MYSEGAGNGSIHIAVGFFFFVNYCIGTGFLRIPYSFVYTGYIAAIPTIIVITLAMWIGSNYILEVSARVQVFLHYKRSKEDPDDDGINSKIEATEQGSSLIQDEKLIATLPPRKYEIIDLCDLFFHRYIKYFYLVAQTASLFAQIWADATIAGSAWAIVFPFYYIHSDLACSEDAFFHHNLPSGGCLYAYYLSVAFYACVAIGLSSLDLEKQAVFQVLLGIMRFASVFLIIVFCLVHIIQGGDACAEYDTNGTLTKNIPLDSLITRFDFKSWLRCITTYAFACIFIFTIPSFIYPIRQKKYLQWLLLSVVATVFLNFLLIGLTVSLWFRAAVREKCTLNWAAFINSPHPLPTRILSYYIILFPALNVISTVPLGVHVIVNGIYIIITGEDTSEIQNDEHSRLVLYILRLTVALLPFAAALGTTNLVQIIDISGFFTIICFVMPYLLQIRSIQVCKKLAKEYTEMDTTTIGNGERNKLQNKTNSSLQSYANNNFRTPYSFPVISSPISAVILAAFGFSLYGVLILVFMINSSDLECESVDRSITNTTFIL